MAVISGDGGGEEAAGVRGIDASTDGCGYGSRWIVVGVGSRRRWIGLARLEQLWWC